MRPYPRQFYKSARLRHFLAGALASFLLVTFFVGVVGCDRSVGQSNAEARGVDVEVDVRPAPCDSTGYTTESPVTERREVDPSGNVRVKVTVRTCCCCGYGYEGTQQAGYVPPSPITGTGPGGPPGASPSTPPVASGSTPPSNTTTPPVATPPVATAPPLRTVPPVGASYPGGVPVGTPAPLPPVAVTNFPWWITLAAAPLALFQSDGGEDYPEGIICGDDSGLPTGPSRPRCN